MTSNAIVFPMFVPRAPSGQFTLEIVGLNRATHCLEMRNPFDFHAEGLVSKNSRVKRSELFNASEL